MNSRRDFLKGTAWMGAVAMFGGCEALKLTNGGTMQGFACAPLKKVRVGVVGVGRRGCWAVERLSQVPGVYVTALCDIDESRLVDGDKAIAKSGKPAAKHFLTSPDKPHDGYRRLCESDLVDVVYNTTPWQYHVPASVYAMKCGKHTAIEVPCCMNIDECWELVETAEATQRHCIPLENCCYGDSELLALNLVRSGVLGELIHGEGAYIHDLAAENFAAYKGSKFFTEYNGTWDRWRLKWNQKLNGNPYPTHGFGPICQYMGINRGDALDYVVSVSSREARLTEFAKETFGPDSPEAKETYALGDVNTSVFRTFRGRTIMVQHDVSLPRPYNRINLIAGTKGILRDYPLRVALLPHAHEWMKEEELKALKAKYEHPLYKTAGEIAKKVGGHGGMDFMMDLRWAYCLQNGLPMDADVYDAATWSCLTELAAESANNRGKSINVPDFTRGGWKTAEPLGIVNVDLAKLDFGDVKLHGAEGQFKKEL